MNSTNTQFPKIRPQNIFKEQSTISNRYVPIENTIVRKAPSNRDKGLYRRNTSNVIYNNIGRIWVYK